VRIFQAAQLAPFLWSEAEVVGIHFGRASSVSKTPWQAR
jgi:hypothetical protein